MLWAESICFDGVSLMVGQIISHYRILAKLSGGLGVVCIVPRISNSTAK